MLDAIIIGQGIAGTTLSYRMLCADMKIMVIDRGHQVAASKVAAGLVNPITGRHYAKSWIIDELLPEAVELYDAMSHKLDIEVMDRRTIVRSLPTAEDENQWYSRLDKEGYKPYMSESHEGADYSKYLNGTLGYGHINQSMSIRTGELLTRWRDVLKDRDSLLEEVYDETQLIVDEDYVEYNGLKAERLIYCSGWRDSLSTFWSHLGFRPVKGEAMIVRIPSFPTDHIVKHHKFLAPQSDDLFWLGGTYAWDAMDETPTKEKHDELKSYLDTYLKLPYEILDHQAAVRPATKYHRPFVGTHPRHQRLHIFGGLGTKGFSLAPYWSARLMEHIYKGSPMSTELPSLDC